MVPKSSLSVFTHRRVICVLMLLVLAVPMTCHAGGIFSKVGAWWSSDWRDTTASNLARELEQEVAKTCALKISLYFNTLIYISLQESNGEDALFSPLAELHEREPKLRAEIAAMVYDASNDFIELVLNAVGPQDKENASNLIGLLRQRVRILV